MRAKSMQASWAMAIPCLALAAAPVAVGCVDDSETGLTQTDDNRGPDTGDATACRRDSDCAALADLGECEIGVCRTSTGECVVAIADDFTVCDDSDACTARSFCNDGACVAFPNDTVDCDDGDACTFDTCGANGSCRHQPIEHCGVPVVRCGDGQCDAGEAGSCEADCQIGGGGGGGGGQPGCGDGVCDQQTLEQLWCQADCQQGGGGGGGGGQPGCGDGVCDQQTLEQYWCQADCQQGGGGGGGTPTGCGDGVCDEPTFEKFWCQKDCPSP